MKNWTISRKLLSLVAIAIVSFVGMGLYGIRNTRSTFAWVREVNTTAQEFQRSTKEISVPLHRVRELTLSIVMAPDRAMRESLKTAQEVESRRIDTAFQNWPVAPMPAQERTAFEKLQAAWEDYKKIQAHTIDRVLKGYREEAFINAIDTAARQFDLVTSQLEDWQMTKITAAQAVYREADAQLEQVVATSLLVTVLTTLLVGGAAFLIVRSITGPIDILTTTASRIADQVDDTQAEAALAPVLNGGGEVGQLARSFWRMVDSLRTTLEMEIQSRTRMDTILKSTREAVGQLGSTSAELLASTKEQTSGAENQADAVARIVTTVEEITQAAREAASRATGVGQTVQRTLDIGNAGRKAVDDSVAALNGVKQQVEQTGQNMMALVQQTKAIADIIATVDDISRQSDLLAVNAAIEAAKAGESGHEFTVIAGEIKAMAEQSRQGTAQVRQILRQILQATNTAVASMEGVTQGVSGAITVGDQSSQAINKLALALAEVAETSAQTVLSAQQEARGMAQINDAMKHIDRVAKQILNANQGTAQAARQLNQLGNQFTQLSAE